LSMQITRCPLLKKSIKSQRSVCKNTDFKKFSFVDNHLRELAAQKSSQISIK